MKHQPSDVDLRRDERKKGGEMVGRKEEQKSICGRISVSGLLEVYCTN